MLCRSENAAFPYFRRAASPSQGSFPHLKLTCTFHNVSPLIYNPTKLNPCSMIYFRPRFLCPSKLDLRYLASAVGGCGWGMWSGALCMYQASRRSSPHLVKPKQITKHPFSFSLDFVWSENMGRSQPHGPGPSILTSLSHGGASEHSPRALFTDFPPLAIAPLGLKTQCQLVRMRLSLKIWVNSLVCPTSVLMGSRTLWWPLEQWRPAAVPLLKSRPAPSGGETWHLGTTSAILRIQRLFFWSQTTPRHL